MLLCVAFAHVVRSMVFCSSPLANSNGVSASLLLYADNVRSKFPGRFQLAAVCKSHCAKIATISFLSIFLVTGIDTFHFPLNLVPSEGFKGVFLAWHQDPVLEQVLDQEELR